MSCTLTKGFSVDCQDSIGGLKAVYLCKEYVSNMRSAADFNATDPLQMDTGGFTAWIDSAGTSVSTPTCFRYLLRPGASNLNTTINASSENGTTFFTQTLSLTLPKLSVKQTNEIKLICQSRVQVWVQDNMDNMFLIGMDNGCETTGGTVVTGAARGDMSGFTLTMVGEELEPMIWLDRSIGGTTPSALQVPFNGLSDASGLTVTAG
tara:strand:- start:11087 stop:11707 length:621 start_codon:yes stop_codon:yes gene_type:complete